MNESLTTSGVKIGANVSSSKFRVFIVCVAPSSVLDVLQ
jgi:hypothetical protein